LAVAVVDHERLDVLEVVAAGGRVAIVADRDVAAQKVADNALVFENTSVTRPGPLWMRSFVRAAERSQETMPEAS
jgi:hypothetical protein